MSLGNAFAQSIDVATSICGDTNQTLNQTATTNGKPEFTCTSCLGGVQNLTVNWTGSRWEMNGSIDGLIAINNADTANPPCSANFPWTNVICDVTVFGDCSATLASSSSASIPTLSEWGLIILALLLMTLGTLYLVQPKFRDGIFEQER